ncbi:MAG TPA: aspartate aminotransferase family protein [Gemmatimonadota bacterium]|nr:aspartate aminotransferase family protein [Gemmatimonadota bacterium]
MSASESWRAASEALARRLRAVESRNVTFVSGDFPVFWERAEGARVVDADGREYVDLTAAFAVAATGHRHPAVVRAVREQAGRLIHGMGDVHPPAVKVELLEALAGLLPYEEPKIVLGVTGSDAVEAALKTAALATGKPGVVAFTGAYHGLGYGALSVTDRDHFRLPFEAQLNPAVPRAPYPHPFRPPQGLEDASRPGPALAALERVLDAPGRGDVGAVILEPAQGRGGEVVPPPGFVAGVRDVCRERGLLLIADEIYTGLGRTGRWLACDAEAVVPDLLCLGKALSGGMPISACAGPADVMDAWPASTGEAIHTSTFLGHPLSCAAALASLGVLEEEGLVRRARELGERWMASLRGMAAAHEVVGEVRGRGLMVGIDLVRDPETREPAPELARRVVTGALREGWILLAGGPAGNVLSLTPPLTIEEDLLERSVGILDGLLAGAREA